MLHQAFAGRPTSVVDRSGLDNWCVPDQSLCLGACQNYWETCFIELPAPMPVGPPKSTPRPPIPDSWKGCCTDEKIAEGKEALQAAYDELKKELKKNEVQKQFEKMPSCKVFSTKVLRALAPYPPCWLCLTEERGEDEGDDPIPDHQVVVCESWSDSGVAKEELIFDYWSDDKWTLEQFRTLWPHLDFRTYVGWLSECSGEPIRNKKGRESIPKPPDWTTPY